jgi:hypothetical protein
MPDIQLTVQESILQIQLELPNRPPVQVEESTPSLVKLLVPGPPGPANLTGMPQTVVLPLPNPGDDIPLFLSRSAMTVSEIRAVIRAETAPASVKISIGFAPGIKDAITSWVVQEQVVNSQSIPQLLTLAAAAVPADQQVRLLVLPPADGIVQDLTIYLRGNVTTA